MNSASYESLVTLAEALADDHANMMASLVALRRETLTQAEVGERMGVTQPTVAELERYDANPRLSTVRRYALAVGAIVTTRVERANLDPAFHLETEPSEHVWATDARTWTTSESYGREDGMGYVPVQHLQMTLHQSTEDPENILSMSASVIYDIVQVKEMA